MLKGSAINKLFLIIQLLVIITSTCYAQNPFSPYNEVKPKGKIDSVIITYGNVEGKHVYIYNKHCQLIESTWYRGDVLPDGIGRVSDTIKTVFNYNASRHLVSGIMVYKGIKSPTRYEYSATKYGYAIHTIDPRDSDPSLVYEMRFNNSGRIIQSGYYALNDLEHQRPGNIEYRYDKKGCMIERLTYSQLPQPHKLFYKYNSGGEMVAINREDADDLRNSTYSYPKYDKMHNWTERIVTNGGGFTHTDYRRITYYK